MLIFFFENLAFYEIMWKTVVESGRPQMAIKRMRVACWMTKATNTYAGYVIFIALPLRRWLHERGSVLCLYVHCLSCVFLRAV